MPFLHILGGTRQIEAKGGLCWCRRRVTSVASSWRSGTLQEDLPFKRRTQHPGETQRGETQRGETQRGDTQSGVTQRGEASLQYSPSLVEPLSGAGSQAERLLPPPVQKQSGVAAACQRRLRGRGEAMCSDHSGKKWMGFSWMVFEHRR
ncbi:hypothetical protein CRUP_011764 [Coryphaenoides rupestris]|nr:hypothetical protein CRUP_011764 [Coryphaenoides rupestris]